MFAYDLPRQFELRATPFFLIFLRAFYETNGTTDPVCAASPIFPVSAKQRADRFFEHDKLPQQPAIVDAARDVVLGCFGNDRAIEQFHIRQNRTGR